MSRQKFQRELYLVSDNLLGYLSKKKWVVTKDENKQVRHQPIGYDKYAISLLLESLPQYDLKQLKYASDMLVENQHADILNAKDWLEIKISCTEKGEAAFDTGFYKDLYDKTAIEQRETLHKKYWWVVAIIAFLIGWLAEIGKEALTRKLLPGTTQSTPSPQGSSDTLKKNF